MEIRKAAVLGLGAIGCTIAPGLQKALGNNFCVIASGIRKNNLEQKGKIINGKRVYFRVSDINEQEKEDLIIIAVKAAALEQAVHDIAAHVGEHTMIMSLMNGVTSEQKIAEKYGADKVIYSLTTISSQMIDGAVQYSLKAGKIKFGEKNNIKRTQRVQAIADLFTSAEIPYDIPKDMELAIWKKYLFNVSNNSVAAVLHARHFYFQNIAAANEARKIVLMEVAKVALAMKISITQEMLADCMYYSSEYPPDGYCSMVQDIEAGRKSENNIFLGDLIRMADRLQIDVPVCRFLYQIIEAIEEAGACGRNEHMR